ncbi:uncharacterized protein LOC119174684 [Rhipicephalus microplus]|uniref:uncharacterized protein LOC119174684 n=1 Tax=Rhipicephalus microplus TaxID=6941 RepID=UPI003F6C4AB6
MRFTTVFAVLALSTAVQAVPSARTFTSYQHPQHNIPAHNQHSHQHVFPGVQQNTANHGHQVHVEDDSSVAVLVCQVVKVPAGRPVPQPAPAVPATPPIAAGSPSIVVSSQETLSNLTTRVRTAVDSLVEPIVTALQNASLWLNRTSQQHLSQHHQHMGHQQGGHNHHAHQHALPNHHAHQHMHVSQFSQHGHHGHEHQHGVHANHHLNNEHHQANAVPAHQTQGVVHEIAVPMTVVSVPVMIPAVHAGSFPLVNISSIVPVGVNVASLQFSSAVRNGTSFGGSSAASVAATTQSAATPTPAGPRFRANEVFTPEPIVKIPGCPDSCYRR